MKIENCKLRGEGFFNPGRSSKLRGGFTLVEVLISIFILSLIFSILYPTFFPTVKVIDRLEERRESLKAIESGLQILSHDIRTASPPAENKVFLFQGSSRSTGQPIITFSSYTSFQRGGLGRLRKVEYTVEEDLAQRDTFILRRLVYKDSEEVLEDDILIDGLEEIDLSFYDGKEWKEKWDSSASKGLPRGVKVKLSSEAGSFTSVIPIEGS